MKQNKNLFKVLIAFGIMALLAVGMLIAYNQFKPQGEEGSKNIVVEVVIPEEDSKEFKLNTDALYLREALEEENLIKGDESEFGLLVTEVNGRAVDAAKNEWWFISKDGVGASTGVDSIAILDGEHYEITLTVGY